MTIERENLEKKLFLVCVQKEPLSGGEKITGWQKLLDTAKSY